jgi:transposase-like protein
MNTCPYCQATSYQAKNGLTEAGSQRYKCQLCGRKYTPAPREHGYPNRFREQAVKLYSDGMNFRRIARHLGVSHQTVINWVNAAVAQLPPPAMPETAEVIEMDELYTFIERKKRSLRDDLS